MMCGCGSVACTMCKREWVVNVVEWAEGRGLSLGVKGDERVGVGGWMGWM